MFAFPAPRATCLAFTDEYLEHWSSVYTDRRVRDYGVHFEHFLLDPEPILKAIDSGRLLRLDQIISPREMLAEAR